MNYIKRITDRQLFIIFLFVLPVVCKIDQLLVAKLPLVLWVSAFNHELLVFIAFAVLIRGCRKHRQFGGFVYLAILLLVIFNILVLVSNTVYHSFGLIYKHGLIADMPFHNQIKMVTSYVTGSLFITMAKRIIVGAFVAFVIAAIWEWKKNIFRKILPRNFKIIVTVQLVIVFAISSAFPHIVDEQELSLWVSLKSFAPVVEEKIEPDVEVMPAFRAGKLQYHQFRKPARFDDLPKRDNPYNLVIYSMESTRAISSSAYDGLSNTAPFLLSVKDKGLFFEKAYGHSARSIKSLVPVLLGEYPYYNINTWAWQNLSSRIRYKKTLPNVLKRNGYYTSFFVNSDITFDQRDTFLPKFAFDNIQGEKEFISMDDSVLVTKLDRFFTLAHAENKPLFSVLLSSSAHSPFKYPEFPKDNGKIKFENAQKEAQAYGVLRKYREVLYPSYLRSIRHQDDVAKYIYEYLSENDLLKDTIYVILGDHGESFGEHGHRGGIAGHGNSLYEETIKIPLWIHHPDIGAKRVKDPVQFVDLLPTLLAMLNISTDHKYLGRNVLVEPRKSLYFSNFVKQKTIAIMQYPFKLIRNGERDNSYIYELYDLENDPRERMNLIRTTENSIKLKKSLAEFDIFLPLYQDNYARIADRENGAVVNRQGTQVAKQEK